ncbi:MAG: hypothetical protein D6798_06510 [Deltaproteobacteria bacterium]|nr:MAG: hypothetical protein D6798_06510 [Deltaproteobacteria bacterium]
MRPVADFPHALILAVAMVPGSAMAADSIQQVAMGRNLSGDGVRIAAWTTTGPTTPAGVHVELTPYPGVPALGEVEMTEPRMTRQLWTVPAVGFAGDADGGLYLAHVTLYDDEAQVLDTVDIEVTAGALTCSRSWTWGGFGSAHAHLDVNDQGTAARLGVVVAGPDAPRVASVRVDMAAGAGAAPLADTHYTARLDTVQQLWTATVASGARPGDRHQVDAVLLDGEHRPYGTAYVSHQPVGSRAPATRADCPWPPSTDSRVAAR